MRDISSPQDAIDAGLGMVHQHFELVPGFTVAQNVLLGREPVRRGLYDDRGATEAVARIAEQTGLDIDPSRRVGTLPIGMQQRVEILKALAADARTLIFDEPTAVLTPSEADDLVDLIRRLAASGRSVLFISHKLPEVQAVADRIIVMRLGRVVATLSRGDADEAELARRMVGRDVEQPAASPLSRRPGVALKASGIRLRDTPGDVEPFDFTLHEGEVLGIAGVSGNGQDELIESLAGLTPFESGSVLLRGKQIAGLTPAGVRAAGMSHIAADRMRVGLNLDATLEENAVATSFRSRAFSRSGIIKRRERMAFARRIATDYDVRGTGPTRPVRSLSGGNLQKIVIGRELAGDPAVVLANQPTRGLDVGSIEFVHRSLLDVCADGAGVLLISNELDEVLALSHRVAVMYRGRIIGPFERDEVNRERLGRIMASGEDDR